MIPVIIRSTTPRIIVCLALAAASAYTEPISVIDSFQERFNAVRTFSASVERIQTYRDVKRIGKGAVVYDRFMGCIYSYREPGNYLFAGNDTMACGIDIKKKNGWRSAGTLPEIAAVREQIDPLFRFLRLAVIDKQKLTYRGNSNDLLLFSMPQAGGLRRTVGFDAVTFQCRIAETFDSSGRIVEKVRFSYGKRTVSIFPSEVVISEPAGGGISVDSVVFKRIRINGEVDSDAYSIPDGVRWRFWRDGRLTDKQFDPITVP